MSYDKKQVLKKMSLFLFTAIIFYILFTRIQISEVVEVFAEINFFYLIASVLLLVPIVYFGIERWRILLIDIGGRLSFFECLTVGMAAMPFSLFVPAKTNDFLRSVFLKDKVPITKSVGTVITERFLDVWILTFLSIIGFVLLKTLKYTILSISIFILIICALIASNFLLKIKSKNRFFRLFKETAVSLNNIATNPKLLFKTLVYTMIFWLLAFVQFYFFFKTFSLDVPLFTSIAYMSVVIFIGILPITIGGMGTRDSAIIYLFSSYATPAQLLGVGLIFSLVRVWLLTLLGLPFLAIITKK